MSQARYQIPRNAMVWLLVSMFAGIVPHVLRLPLWVTVICLLCGIWRVMIYRARWALPGQLIKVVLVFSGCAAVWAHFGTLMGPEAGTALLILGFCFKLLETQGRRDAFIVVVLGYFVVATGFFFRQEIVDTLYLLLVCFLVTAALLGLNQSPLQTAPTRTARLALRLMLQATPLMVVLFILVPRFGPIWALDLSSNQARTGLSDEISPGDIANLSRSPKLAFRVQFDGPPPAAEQLYWRALVLDEFDGHTWRRKPAPHLQQWLAWGNTPPAWENQIERLEQPLRYRVLMEPTDQRWLFALSIARPLTKGIGVTRDFRLVNRRPVSQSFSYQVESVLAHLTDRQLPHWLRERNLQLPEDGNPRSRALAEALYQASNGPADYLERVLQRFTALPYRYTLSPTQLAGDRVDQFLFDTREGFCSHYASALVFLMRSVGIPARIVAGYQGGEYNQLGGYLLVHQFDAHAWAEVWLPGRGWTRVDPTARVAPERVEQGLEQAMAGEGSFLADSPFNPVRYRHWPWVSKLRLSWDYVNYVWRSTVVGYSAEHQRRWLSEWFGRFDWRILGGLLAGGVAIVLAALALWVLVRQRPKPMPPLVREYQLLCRRMEARGSPPKPGEPPGQYLARMAAQDPQRAETWLQLSHLLECSFYRASEAPEPLQLVRRYRRLLDC